MIFFCHLGMKIHSPRKKGCHIIEYSFQNWIIFSTGVIVGTLCNWGDDKTMHYVWFGPTYILRNVKWLFCWLCAVEKTLSFAFGGFLVCQELGPSIFYLFLPLLWVLCFIDDWQVFHQKPTCWCRIWAENFGWNLTQCVSETWSTMCAYDGWACCIEVHASGWEILHPVREVFSLKFEPAIKGRVIPLWADCYYVTIVWGTTSWTVSYFNCCCWLWTCHNKD
jgi:hypothetical protein